MYKETISGKLTCDICGRAITWEKHRARTRVEAEAREAGWRISPKGHRCPDCDWPGTMTPEERREHMRAYQREYLRALSPEEKERRRAYSRQYAARKREADRTKLEKAKQKAND